MRKAISIFLSILLFVSSSGLAYAQHYCGGMEMMSQITLGHTNLSCGMESDEQNITCDEETLPSEAHDCCDNHVTKINLDDNFAKASFDIKLNKTFVATFTSIFIIHEVEILTSKKNFFAEYNPPPLEQDLNILYDTFLI